MNEQGSSRYGIPSGMTRVLGVDLFAHEDYVVGDFLDRDEAFRVADAHNKGRGSSLDDVYYVCDDRGYYIRGNESVRGPGVSP